MSVHRYRHHNHNHWWLQDISLDGSITYWSSLWLVDTWGDCMLGSGSLARFLFQARLQQRVSEDLRLTCCSRPRVKSAPEFFLRQRSLKWASERECCHPAPRQRSTNGRQNGWREARCPALLSDAPEGTGGLSPCSHRHPPDYICFFLLLSLPPASQD